MFGLPLGELTLCRQPDLGGVSAERKFIGFIANVNRLMMR